MKITNIHAAKSTLSQLIESALQGEEVIISKAGQPLVRLVPYSSNQEPRTPGDWAGQVKMADDFDTTPQEIIQGFYGEET
jgi:prevent-host-death family protein